VETEYRASHCRRIERYNRDFALSYRSWFESVYKDKYEYMGEWDLMSLAFRLDLGLYYLGIVSQPFKLGVKAVLSPPFTTSLSRPVFHLMRTYNPRFAQIARRRRRLGALGKSNRGRRCLIKGFTLSRGDIRLLFKPLFKWGWLELKEGWRSWWQPRENKVPVKIAAMPEQRETVGDSSLSLRDHLHNGLLPKPVGLMIVSSGLAVRFARPEATVA
jgi:hypothetical protein